MPFFAKFSCGGSRNELKEITVLNYSHNNLTYVPEEIILHERSLEELFLDANRITELPRVIFFKTKTRKSLSFTKNLDLKNIKWLFQCYGLRTLCLTDNELQVLPSAIASLINLENLDISKNAFREIPDAIKCCKKLTVLDASVNPIQRWSFKTILHLHSTVIYQTFKEIIQFSINPFV